MYHSRVCVCLHTSHATKTADPLQISSVSMYHNIPTRFSWYFCHFLHRNKNVIWLHSPQVSWLITILSILYCLSKHSPLISSLFPWKVTFSSKAFPNTGAELPRHSRPQDPFLSLTNTWDDCTAECLQPQALQLLRHRHSHLPWHCSLLPGTWYMLHKNMYWINQ